MDFSEKMILKPLNDLSTCSNLMDLYFSVIPNLNKYSLNYRKGFDICKQAQQELGESNTEIMKVFEGIDHKWIKNLKMKEALSKKMHGEGNSKPLKRAQPSVVKWQKIY